MSGRRSEIGLAEIREGLRNASETFDGGQRSCPSRCLPPEVLKSTLRDKLQPARFQARRIRPNLMSLLRASAGRR